ncbi:PKD domain-containing protein [Nocardioides sp.]|uniref:PKD domain-containing protein n=1 Tax=Nocardioides sp. TaxID=35761 RepID=UPI002C152750|nr:PKD domain-containing protein [Nocardioides sp.]HXH79761.1 PKD domain-containing protein [Nocardioides sp.]
MRCIPRLPVAASAALIVLTATFGVPGASHAEPSWLSSVTTVWEGQLNESDLVLDADGNAVVVWSAQWDGVWSVVASTRPAGGDWSTARRISEGSNAIEPQVAVDGSGRAVAVWREWTATASVIRTATLVGGAWTERQTLSADGQHAFQPQVAVSPHGAVAVAWTRNDGSPMSTSVAQVAVGVVGETWKTTTLSGAGAAGARVGVADDGAAVAVWQQGDDVVTASGTARGQWSKPEQLSTRPDSLSPSVAVSPSGEAVVVWMASGFRDNLPGIQSASRSAGGAWTTAQDLTAPGFSAWEVDLGVDANGDAVAAWTVNPPGAPRVVQAGRRGSDGRWTIATVSDPATHASGAQVGFGSGQTSAVLWTASTDPTSAGGLWVSTASQDARWAAPTRITDDSEAASPGDLAVDRDGNALVVWRGGGAAPALRSRAFDGVGPVITPVVDTIGLPGARLQYAVKARDAWSDVASVQWTFADGTRSHGTRATHRYKRPGVYGVRVRATDSVGNTTTTTLNAVVADRRPAIERLRLTRASARIRLSAPASVELRVVDRRTRRVVESVVFARRAGTSAVPLPDVARGRYAVKVSARNALGKDREEALLVVRR